MANSRAEADRDDDVVASLAVTLDGYVCRLDGSVDYLDKYGHGSDEFETWVARIGALVMGSASYAQVVEWGWTWGDRPTLVLTTRTDLSVPEGANVTFRDSPTADAIGEFAANTPGRTWVFGGGEVVTAALLGGVVDTLDITIMPEALGSGIPLFTEPVPGPMTIIESTAYDYGGLRVVYDASQTKRRGVE